MENNEQFNIGETDPSDMRSEAPEASELLSFGSEIATPESGMDTLAHPESGEQLFDFLGEGVTELDAEFDPELLALVNG
jgi:hypothetical protein